MKKFIVIISFALCILSSCSKDSLNDNIRLDDIVGSWYGTSSYINPVSGRKYQYLEFSFYSDYTGEFYRDTPSGITVGYFNYKIKGNVIKCSGYVVYSDGDMEERDIELLKEGDRLIPQTTYTNFILTMDGSVETDMEGNELIDNTQLLLNVWVCNSSPLVMDIENSRTYCEYILKEYNSNFYTSINEGDYYYDFRSNTIQFGETLYDILEFNSKKFKIKRQIDSVSFDFSLGTENDIPTQVDLKGFLIVPFLWVANNNNYQMRFNADGSMHILQYSRINSDVIMTAEGTYTIEGNYAICNLTPSWFGGNAGSFPGWEKGKPCVKKLKIEVVGATSIKVTYEDGTVLTYKHF